MTWNYNWLLELIDKFISSTWYWHCVWLSLWKPEMEWLWHVRPFLYISDLFVRKISHGIDVSNAHHRTLVQMFWSAALNASLMLFVSCGALDMVSNWHLDLMRSKWFSTHLTACGEIDFIVSKWNWRSMTLKASIALVNNCLSLWLWNTLRDFFPYEP